MVLSREAAGRVPGKPVWFGPCQPLFVSPHLFLHLKLNPRHTQLLSGVPLAFIRVSTVFSLPGNVSLPFPLPGRAFPHRTTKSASVDWSHSGGTRRDQIAIVYIMVNKWKRKSLSCVRLFATPWTVRGILQARILEWVAFPFSRMVNKGLCFTKLPVVLIPPRLFCSLRTHLLSPWHKMTHCWSLLREERLPGRRAGMRPPTWKGLGKEVATHSSILACRIPWTEEPGGLMFMGSQRVGHDWVTKHTWIGRWAAWADLPVLRVWARSCTPDFHSHPLSQNWVT